MDKIIVNGLKVFAYHGVNLWEREDGQTFIVDVEATVDLTMPCTTDSVDDTVNYAKLIKSIQSIMTSEKNKLIERVAQRIANGLLAEFSAISSLKIRLLKPDAPVKAEFGYVAVEIERKRGK